MTPRWHLRYQPHDDGSWTYHVAVGFIAACGAVTEPCEAAEHHEALLGLLGHDTGDAAWCPACARVVADEANRRTETPPTSR